VGPMRRSRERVVRVPGILLLPSGGDECRVGSSSVHTG
jgi:hypothetical protein